MRNSLKQLFYHLKSKKKILVVSVLDNDLERDVYIINSILLQSGSNFKVLLYAFRDDPNIKTYRQIIHECDKEVNLVTVNRDMNSATIFIDAINEGISIGYKHMLWLPHGIALYDAEVLANLIIRKELCCSEKYLKIMDAGDEPEVENEISKSPIIINLSRVKIKKGEKCVGQLIKRDKEDEGKEVIERIEENNNVMQSVLQRNKKFKQICRGECIILGNGPSLKEVDFKLLNNKYVICCNFFYRNENFKSVKPNAYVVVDGAFWGERQALKFDEVEINEFWHEICKLGIPIFVPISAREYIETNRLDRKADFFYLNVSSTSIPSINISSEEIELDITKQITTYTNVIQFAIVIAIYMGFDSIKLAGCDATNIINTLKVAIEDKVDNTHSYANDNAIDYFQQLLNNMGMGEILYWESVNFMGYELLYHICEQKGIELINCSTKTLINKIPRGDISLLYS